MFGCAKGSAGPSAVRVISMPDGISTPPGASITSRRRPLKLLWCLEFRRHQRSVRRRATPPRLVTSKKSWPSQRATPNSSANCRNAEPDPAIATTRRRNHLLIPDTEATKRYGSARHPPTKTPSGKKHSHEESGKIPRHTTPMTPRNRNNKETSHEESGKMPPATQHLDP